MDEIRLDGGRVPGSDRHPREGWAEEFERALADGTELLSEKDERWLKAFREMPNKLDSSAEWAWPD